MKQLFTVSEKAQALAEYSIIFSLSIAVLFGVFISQRSGIRGVVDDMAKEVGVTIINDGDSTKIMTVDDNNTCDGAMDDDCIKDDKDDKCTGQTKDENGNDHNNDGHTDCGENGNGHDNGKKDK